MSAMLLGSTAAERRDHILGHATSIVPGSLAAMFNVSPTATTGQWLLDEMGVRSRDPYARAAWSETSGTTRALPWDPERPPPDDVLRFTGLNSTSHHVVFSNFYHPFDFVHQRRLLAYEGGALTGWLAILRSSDWAFNPEESRALDLASAEIAGLVAAEDRLRRERADGGCHLILHPDGRVDRHSKAAEALVRERGCAREDVVRAYRAGVKEFTVDGVVHRLVGLDGGGGERILCSLQPAIPVRLRADAVLTERQRQVAAEAIDGGTIGSIATSLGVSPETVRKHLRLTYRKLGVRNRVQLARALW